LKREVQKVETELNYLRTQPVTSPRSEPDAIQDLSWKGGSRTADADDQARTPPASAPVYEAEGDLDDDTYSGGRAV
jgi:hypothetical protein